MSQRVSGYKRKANEAYYTPAWVTEALLPHLRIAPPAKVHEPADGNGAISRVLRKQGFKVSVSDLTRGKDFLQTPCCAAAAIITNPPYRKGRAFIEHALDLMRPHGIVAMLLRVDFDSAAGRKHLFEDHPAFAKRVVLRKRIRWIANSTGSPSYNHCWFIWDWQWVGMPVVRYAA